jgi:bacteriocin-like protein
MIFGFQKKLDEEELTQTSGGYAKHSGSLYVFMQ